jgi:crossover junction endodeoxyribonuclease RuvC
VSIILGIDPGSRVTGYGVIRVQSPKHSLEYIASGCIKVAEEETPQKLHQIFQDLSLVIQKYQPTEVAIEQIFMHHNVSSALKLGQARGAAIVAAAHYHLPVAEYTARQVKQAVASYGAAEKKQVQQMVRAVLNLSKAPQVDAADALAVAICHSHTRGSVKNLVGVRGIARGRWR